VSPEDPPLTLATAGHIDHGKTALVALLTGRDTDRLAAEKARGISIELGFAPLDLPSGRRLGLVDVPGHERFVRHMVAGAGGVDGYLLCVAADDGVMPQTREHLAVLGLLDVRDGVVAVTKADLSDPGPAERGARELVGAGATVVAVSSRTGQGLDDLRAALDVLAGRLARRTARGPARLFVDRCFTVAGAGTVVTGTLWGAPIEEGARVSVLPGGAEGRVRSVQAHDRPIERATGGRVAVNLAGVGRARAPRGSCVVRREDGWSATERLDVALTWLADAGRPLRSRRRLEAFLGTAEAPATCVLLDRDALAPGELGYAQLRLGRPVPAVAGDRLVLRSSERRTVGGAVVIDPAPERHGRGSGAAERLAAIERGEPSASPPPRPSEPHPGPPPAPVAHGGAVLDEVAAALAEGGLSPPPPAALADRLALPEPRVTAALAALRDAGGAVAAGGLWFDAAAAAGARAEAERALTGGPMTLGELRDLWGVSRRRALALAEHLDARGVTRRVGEGRVLRRGARGDVGIEPDRSPG
jgi:selenocysteine-specific elongation factor